MAKVIMFWVAVTVTGTVATYITLQSVRRKVL